MVGRLLLDSSLEGLLGWVIVGVEWVVELVVVVVDRLLVFVRRSVPPAECMEVVLSLGSQFACWVPGEHPAGWASVLRAGSSARARDLLMDCVVDRRREEDGMLAVG